MKKDSGGFVTDREQHPSSSLASFRAMDKDKDSSSLPFPSSVLLTKPIGPSSEYVYICYVVYFTHVVVICCSLFITPHFSYNLTLLRHIALLCSIFISK